MALGWSQQRGWIEAKGQRLRSMLTRPRVGGRHPAVLFLQGLGPLSVDVSLDPIDPRDPVAGLICAWSDAGAVTLRVDRSGVGQSEGPAYDAADLDSEVEGYCAALRLLAEQPFVAPNQLFLFGQGVGGVLAPLIASVVRVAGVITWGAPSCSWSACLAKSARRQLALMGMEPPALDREAELAERFYRGLLSDALDPDTLFDADPELEDCVAARDASGGLLHGRNLHFFRQLEALPVEGLWRKVRPPLYAMQGSFDWIVGSDDHDTIAGWVEAAGGDALSRLFQGVDHDMQHHPSMAASFRRRGSAPFAPEVADESAAWMEARWQRLSIAPLKTSPR